MEGQLIDISGTMSGGGSKVRTFNAPFAFYSDFLLMKPARGGMSSKVVEEFSPAEIVTLEKACAADNEKLTTFRTNTRQLEGQVGFIYSVNHPSDNS